MPLRVIGGISRGDLPNQVGNQPARLLGTASWYDGVPYGLGVEIDAAAEGGVAGVYCPTQWSRVGTIRISLMPLATGNMRLTYNIVDFPRCSGALSGWTANVTIAAVADVIQCITLNLSPYLTILPGAFVTISVIYRAAGDGDIATDLVFLGIVVTEA